MTTHTISPPATSSLLSRVDDLAPIIRKHADEAEENRRLSTPVYEAMVDAGLFRMFVPKDFGGLEVDVVTGFQVAERLSQIDSAAGWNFQVMAIDSPTTAALLPEEGAREIYSDPRAVAAGGFNPPGAAVEVDGGYRLTGRWPFVSGCQHANWFADPALLMKDGEPVMTEHGPVMLVFYYPASEAEIIETWNPLGMRGTGSHDIAVNEIFVPASRSGALRPFEDLGKAFQGPLYKLGLIPTIMGNAVSALGVAQTAIDEAVELAKSKIPAFQQTRPVDRGVVHMHLARAEASLAAARAYFYTALEDAWQSAVEGQRPTTKQRLHTQLAASYAADTAARAVDHVHAAMGSSGVREEQHRFARHFRDVHTITQHALCSATRFESMGQIMLGLPTDWPFIEL
jgi:alkylation response protein AidB-like acyl-CoA dehydrogenase